MGLIVLLSARHLCMEARGVRKPGVYTRTSALRGMVLDDVGMKDEFYHLIGLPSAVVDFSFGVVEWSCSLILQGGWDG